MGGNATVDPKSYLPIYYWEDVHGPVESIFKKPVDVLSGTRIPSTFSDGSKSRAVSNVGNDEETIRNRVLQAIGRKLQQVPEYNYNLASNQLPSENTIMVKPQRSPQEIAIRTRLIGA